MAKFYKGDMWDRLGKVDIFAFTGNSYIKSNGALVMGRGMAKQVRDKFPGIDLEFGKIIKDCVTPQTYGFCVDIYEDYLFGCFQVKTHFKNKATLDLIKYSVVTLFGFLVYDEPLTVALNFPGIGNGQLNKEDVLPIISLLPDNVEIWEYDDKELF